MKGTLLNVDPQLEQLQERDNQINQDILEKYPYLSNYRIRKVERILKASSLFFQGIILLVNRNDSFCPTDQSTSQQSQSSTATQNQYNNNNSTQQYQQQSYNSIIIMCSQEKNYMLSITSGIALILIGLWILLMKYWNRNQILRRQNMQILFLIFVSLVQILVFEIYVFRLIEYFWSALFSIQLVLLIERYIKPFKIGLIAQIFSVVYIQIRFAIQQNANISSICFGFFFFALLLLQNVSNKVLYRSKMQILQITRNQLNSVRQFYNDLLGLIPQGLTLLDSSQNIIYANSRVTEILQCDEQDIFSILVNLSNNNNNNNGEKKTQTVVDKESSKVSKIGNRNLTASINLFAPSVSAGIELSQPLQTVQSKIIQQNQNNPTYKIQESSSEFNNTSDQKLNFQNKNNNKNQSNINEKKSTIISNNNSKHDSNENNNNKSIIHSNNDPQNNNKINNPNNIANNKLQNIEKCQGQQNLFKEIQSKKKLQTNPILDSPLSSMRQDKNFIQAESIISYKDNTNESSHNIHINSKHNCDDDSHNNKAYNDGRNNKNIKINNNKNIKNNNNNNNCKNYELKNYHTCDYNNDEYDVNNQFQQQNKIIQYQQSKFGTYQQDSGVDQQFTLGNGDNSMTFQDNTAVAVNHDDVEEDQNKQIKLSSIILEDNNQKNQNIVKTNSSSVPIKSAQIASKENNKQVNNNNKNEQKLYSNYKSNESNENTNYSATIKSRQILDDKRSRNETSFFGEVIYSPQLNPIFSTEKNEVEIMNDYSDHILGDRTMNCDISTYPFQTSERQGILIYGDDIDDSIIKENNKSILDTTDNNNSNNNAQKNREQNKSEYLITQHYENTQDIISQSNRNIGKNNLSSENKNSMGEICSIISNTDMNQQQQQQQQQLQEQQQQIRDVSFFTQQHLGVSDKTIANQGQKEFSFGQNIHIESFSTHNDGFQQSTLKNPISIQTISHLHNNSSSLSQNHHCRTSFDSSHKQESLSFINKTNNISINVNNNSNYNPKQKKKQSLENQEQIEKLFQKQQNNLESNIDYVFSVQSSSNNNNNLSNNQNDETKLQNQNQIEKNKSNSNQNDLQENNKDNDNDINQNNNNNQKENEVDVQSYKRGSYQSSYQAKLETSILSDEIQAIYEQQLPQEYLNVNNFLDEKDKCLTECRKSILDRSQMKRNSRLEKSIKTLEVQDLPKYQEDKCHSIFQPTQHHNPNKKDKIDLQQPKQQTQKKNNSNLLIHDLKKNRKISQDIQALILSPSFAQKKKSNNSQSQQASSSATKISSSHNIQPAQKHLDSRVSNFNKNKVENNISAFNPIEAENMSLKKYVISQKESKDVAYKSIFQPKIIKKETKVKNILSKLLNLNKETNLDGENTSEGSRARQISQIGSQINETVNRNEERKKILKIPDEPNDKNNNLFNNRQIQMNQQHLLQYPHQFATVSHIPRSKTYQYLQDDPNNPSSPKGGEQSNQFIHPFNLNPNQMNMINNNNNDSSANAKNNKTILMNNNINNILNNQNQNKNNSKMDNNNNNATIDNKNNYYNNTMKSNLITNNSNENQLLGQNKNGQNGQNEQKKQLKINTVLNYQKQRSPTVGGYPKELQLGNRNKLKSMQYQSLKQSNPTNTTTKNEHELNESSIGFLNRTKGRKESFFNQFNKEANIGYYQFKDDIAHLQVE